MKKFWILVIFALFSLTYCGLVAQNKKSDKLKKDKQKIQKEIDQKQKLLDETRKNKNASLQQLSILRDQIATREMYMTELQGEIDLLAEERQQNEAESSRLARKLTCLQEDYSRVVYNTFKNRRRNNPLLFILSSEDYSTMFRRIRFYTEYSKNVQKTLDDITETRKNIEEKCAEQISQPLAVFSRSGILQSGIDCLVLIQYIFLILRVIAKGNVVAVLGFPCQRVKLSDYHPHHRGLSLSVTAHKRYPLSPLNLYLGIAEYGFLRITHG